jgi:NADH-quinone oxidoreductase subunit J
MPLLFTFHFYLFGLIAVASALAFVTRRSPIAAALWLVVTMFCLAAMYVMLGADFIGAIQVLVYAGAIMVVFLFVVMLLNLGHGGERSDFRGTWTRIAGGFVGLAVLALVLATTLRDPIRDDLAIPEPPANAIQPVAEAAFRQYLLAFEVTSVLLLAAIVGAVVLAKRRTVRA